MAIIASVFSFRNSFQEIPYKISREGSSKRDGGSGVTYSCNCPHFMFKCSKNGSKCKHIDLALKVISGDIKDDKVIVAGDISTNG